VLQNVAACCSGLQCVAVCVEMSYVAVYLTISQPESSQHHSFADTLVSFADIQSSMNMRKGLKNDSCCILHCVAVWIYFGEDIMRRHRALLR